MSNKSQANDKVRDLSRLDTSIFDSAILCVYVIALSNFWLFTVCVASEYHSNERICYAKVHPNTLYKLDNLLGENSGYGGVESISDCTGHCFSDTEKCRGATYLSRKKTCILHGSTIASEDLTDSNNKKIEKKLTATHVSLYCGDLEYFTNRKVMKYSGIKYIKDNLKSRDNTTSSIERCLKQCFDVVSKCNAVSYEKSTRSCVYHKTGVTLENEKDYECHQDWVHFVIDKGSYVTNEIAKISDYNIKHNSVEISWEAFDGVDGVKKDDGYLVEYSVDGENDWTGRKNVESNGYYLRHYSQIVTGLEPATSYLFRVRLLRNGKMTSPHPAIRAVTKCGEPTEPPINIKAANMEGKLTLSWEPPPKDTWQCFRVQYVIKKAEKGFSAYDISVDPGKEGCSYIFETAILGDELEFKILTQAVEEDGIEGDRSDWSNILKYKFLPAVTPTRMHMCDVGKVYGISYSKDKTYNYPGNVYGGKETYENCVEKCLMCYDPCQSITFGTSSKVCTLHTSAISDLKNEHEYSANKAYVYASIIKCDPIPLPTASVECGKQAPQHLPNLSKHRIINGQQAKPHSWPWQLHLSVEKPTKKVINCGASLIRVKDDVEKSDMFVTAAHCLTEFVEGTTLCASKTGVKAIAGLHDLNQYNAGIQVRKSVRLFPQEDYEYVADGNDIAIVFVDPPFVFSDTVRPVCLPEDAAEIPVGAECVASGWGLNSTTDEKMSPDELNQVIAPCRSADDCRDGYGTEYKEDKMICAGYGTAETCKGDSGGPLHCRLTPDGEWILYGVTSFGEPWPCLNELKPGIYTRVSNHVNWINDFKARSSIK